AGWRGAVAGVVEATIAAMEGLGARRTRIVAAVGPCINQGAYEVGPEFEADLLARDAANARYFKPASEATPPPFDLPPYVARSLRLWRGPRTGRGGSGSLHLRQRIAFLSYRRSTHRSEADYGRQISAIVLT